MEYKGNFVLCLMNMFIRVGFMQLSFIIKKSNSCGWSWHVFFCSSVREQMMYGDCFL